MPIDLNKHKLKDNLDKYKIQEEKKPGILSTIFGGLKTVGNIPGELTKGLIKGIGSTSYGAGKLIDKGLSKIAGVKELGGNKPVFLEAKGITQKIGKATEQIGEFFIPTPFGKINAATKAGKALVFAANMLAEGIKFGGITSLQEGEVGQKSEVATELGAAFPVAGKILSPVGKYITAKLPERLYSSIFKTSADDLAMQVRTKAFAKLQFTNPELFNKLRNYGFIKNINGKVEINLTLAKEALEVGMGSAKTGGSLEGMAEYSYLKQFELEARARDVVSKTKSTVNLGTKKTSYLNLLDDLYNNFVEGGYGKSGFLQSEAKSAKEMYGAIKATKGTKIAADLALRLRRTIDNLRSTSAFRMSTKLSEKQAIFKSAADNIRGELSKVVGLKDIMKEYKMYINFADDLIAEGARRGNTKIVTLFDAIVGGSSMSGNVPGSGLGLLATLRTIQTPAILTFIARTLDKMKGISQPIKNVVIPTINDLTNQE